MGRHLTFDVVADGGDVGSDLTACRLVPPVLALFPRRSLPEFIDDRGKRRENLSS
jgi:hypothetical protein